MCVCWGARGADHSISTGGGRRTDSTTLHVGAAVEGEHQKGTTERAGRPPSLPPCYPLPLRPCARMHDAKYEQTWLAGGEKGRERGRERGRESGGEMGGEREAAVGNGGVLGGLQIRVPVTLKRIIMSRSIPRSGNGC